MRGGHPVTVVCPYYRKCSGCTQLEVAYAKQLRRKDERVREAFAGLPWVDAGNGSLGAVDPIVPSPLPLGYRASTKLCLQMDTFGQASIGLYSRGSKQVVAIPKCPVHHPALNQTVARLFGPAESVGQRLPAPFYNHTKRGFQAGCLKFLTIRASPTTGAVGVILSHTGVDLDQLRVWAKPFGARGLCLYESRLTKEDESRILSGAVSWLAGPETFPYAIAGHSFHLAPAAFFQANFSLTDAFVAAVVGADHGQTLLDLYGGFGAYAWAARPQFEQIYLVDGNASAIATAQAELTREPAGPKAATTLPMPAANITPVHAAVEDFLARLPRGQADKVTHVIVNPPRAGLSPKVKAGLRREHLSQFTGLTYVSCDLATVARDVRELIRASGGGKGLRVQSVQAFDMFPQTDHIEVVVKLRL